MQQRRAFWRRSNRSRAPATPCAPRSSTCGACRYAPRDPTYGLRRYLASPHKTDIDFSLILLGAPAAAPVFVADTVAMFKEPTYHRVRDSSGALRPLAFLFQASENASASVGGWGAWKARFEALRAASVKAGAGNPYLVAMDFTVPRATTLMRHLGFDAISTYALPQTSSTAGTPFASELQQAQQWWAAAAAAGVEVVPQAPSGWDPRPRAQNPPSWVHEGPQHFVPATPADLRGLVNSAVSWTCANPKAAPAATVLMYAWNENSEGGFLIPTLGNGTERVDALAEVLPAKPCAAR